MTAVFTYSHWLSQDEPQAREALGYVCFLSEYGYPELVNFLRTGKKDTLKTLFDKALYDLFSPITEIESFHKKVNLQNSQTATFTLLPRLIAKAIVSGPNVCNAGILHRIKEIFNGEFPFHKRIQFVLTSLEHQAALRAKVRLIEKPRSPVAPANDLIRVTCGLPPDVVVTAWDAQKTAVSALLTDLTQGRVGSCFSTFLAMNQLNANLSKSLDDFHELLAFSSLTKRCNGKQTTYPVIMKPGYHFRDKTFLISRAGSLENGSLIWESPGIVPMLAALPALALLKNL